MNCAAFWAKGGCDSIFLHSITPPGSFLLSSAQVVDRRSWYNGQSCRICRTVWLSFLHVHRGSLNPGTFLRHRKWRRPIFPVRIWVIIALYPFRIWVWIRSVWGEGEGVRIRRSRPRFSLVHSSCHAFLTKSKFAWLLADRKCGTWVCAAFLPSCLSSILPFLFLFFLHPVACLAAESASSFPSIPWCAGIQWNSTSFPWSRRESIAVTILTSMDWPDWFPGLLIAWMEAWLSVNMRILVLSPGWLSVLMSGH